MVAMANDSHRNLGSLVHPRIPSDPILSACELGTKSQLATLDRFARRWRSARLGIVSRGIEVQIRSRLARWNLHYRIDPLG